MQKSAAYLLGFQQGVDNLLDLEKVAELIDALECFETASEFEKQAAAMSRLAGILAKLRKLLSGAGAAAKGPPVAQLASGYKPKVQGFGVTAKANPHDRFDKLMHPMLGKPEGIKSPLEGGGRTTGV